MKVRPPGLTVFPQLHKLNLGREVGWRSQNKSHHSDIPLLGQGAFPWQRCCLEPKGRASARAISPVTECPSSFETEDEEPLPANPIFGPCENKE